MKQPQHDFSAQTDLIATTSLPQVSLLEKSQPNLTLELTRGSPPGTPSRKKKKRNTANSNYCGNVFSGSKMDNDNGSVWINGNAKNCKYWVYLYYTDLSCKHEDKKMFAKITQYYCKSHNPYKILRPKHVLENVSITYM